MARGNHITYSINGHVMTDLTDDSPKALKWYGITTIGCMALSPIISGLLVSANERRELRSSEAMGMLADCIVPFIGGWIVQAAYDAHPEWNAGTGRSRP